MNFPLRVKQENLINVNRAIGILLIPSVFIYFFSRSMRCNNCDFEILGIDPLFLRAEKLIHGTLSRTESIEACFTHVGIIFLPLMFSESILHLRLF